MQLDRLLEEKKLLKIFGFNKFFDDQWNTIQKIFNGERILLIEKTGFGKSLCYQYPATQFKGTTIIFSPLIALMRDQVKFIESKNIPTASINSNQTDDENDEIIRNAITGKYKILFIAPERQENQQWIEAATKINISMVVIDEAHCISVWGHDFRPAYRRIINLVTLLPKNFPVLATTATATPRVEEDIKNQIGKNITSIRGNLLRNNFNLRVVKVNSEDEKMIWLGENISNLPGTGIIYTGTKVSTEQYSRWFEYLQIKSINYNSGLDGESRKEIETGLMHNDYKCVVSTNALGMGIDKPDLRFIVHTQMPQSPIHYYQEIGRAGRDGEPAWVILFFNRKDDLDLLNSFIDGAKPSLDKYDKIINIVKAQRLGLHAIIESANMKQTQVKVILSDLRDQGIINEVLAGRSKKYEYKFNAPALNTKYFEELRKFKQKELQDIVDYTELKTCRMNFLCDYLGDRSSKSCGKCDNDLGKKIKISENDVLKKKLTDFYETFFPILEVENRTNKLINGVAASYYGVSNVGKVIHRCKYEGGGDYPDYLLKLCLKAFRKYLSDTKFDLCLFVPPTESGNLVRNFAKKIADTLKLTFSEGLIKTRTTKAQKIFQTGLLKKDNVAGVFSVSNPGIISGRNILLIDDIFDSGATIKEIGKYLSENGANKIAPLVIAKTVGGDI
ncbi:MAG: RecQ family ATP-dependent DNA helicase [Ignavibacteriales bacterium]|nr:RecQ family ATP-dependent DNA helicase [Ignavibacteriales bacterium]